jgi:hypothetical protein
MGIEALNVQNFLHFCVCFVVLLFALFALFVFWQQPTGKAKRPELFRRQRSDDLPPVGHFSALPELIFYTKDDKLATNIGLVTTPNISAGYSYSLWLKH